MVGVLAFSFVFGLVVGSFATAIAHRVPGGLSIVGPPSPGLAHGAPISPRYPLTELAVGTLFAATVAVYWDEPAEAALGLVFVAMLAAVTLTDLEQRIIPNKILLAGAIAWIAIAAPTDPGSLPEHAVAAIAAGAVFFAVAFAYPQGMGLGDVKLAATMGLFLGRAVAPALLAALLMGSVVGLALIARHGTAARKMAIPFGPFLALGGVVGLLVGDQLVDLYLG